MSQDSRRLERQRRTVDRLRRQLAFEVLVLERMVQRMGPKPEGAPGAQSIAHILENVRARRFVPDE